MMSSLWNLASFLIAIAILIAVHEWGHFWVAKKCGVKVLRFSLGFGKVLWSRIGRDGTEYSLSMIPLGGYVKMLDERIETVPQAMKAQAFNNQSISKRAAIVAAGPLANFAFAIFAFWLVFLIGVPSIKPVVGSVTPHSVAADSGLEKGMMIKAVDGKEVLDWETISYQFVGAVGKPSISLSVTDDIGDHQIVLPLDNWTLTPDEPLPFKRLGFTPYEPEVLMRIAQVTPGGAADKAGFKSDDEIISVNGSPATDWQAFATLIQRSPEIKLDVLVNRQGEKESLSLIPARHETKDRVIGFAGLMPVVKPLPKEYLTEIQYGPFAAVSHAITKTVDVTKLTLDVVGKLITGKVSVQNLSGPISIAKGAGVSAGIGFVYFLGFLGLISVNLGIMNLLPLPVLDGGHLVFFAIEAITHRPVPEKVQEIAFRIGAAILMGLMAIALFNDFARF